MKLLFTCTLIIFIFHCNAQDSGKVQIGSGYGLYEAIYLQGKFQVKENRVFGLSLGHDFGLINNENYFSLTTEYNYLLKKQGNVTNSPWFISPKLHFTRLDNEYYLWYIMFYSITIGKTIYISEKINLSFDAGPAFKLVFYFRRKTFEEVAWPYNIRPNIRFMLHYKL